MPSSAEPITNRQLNRATLERQLLLRRASMPLTTAVAKLVGLQAQNPLDPYLALWSRIVGFDPDALGRLVSDRSLVRIAVMRGTIHLLTADDALWLRPLTQPVLTAELARHREFAPALAGVDLEPIMAIARQLLSNTPLSGPRLRASLADRFPHVDPAALAYACRCLLPLVQAPPRGVWGRARQVEVVTLESWVGKPLHPTPSRSEMVLRYLAAFGPASVADIANWSRLTGWREVVEKLRPQLLTFRNERGTELFDLPEAPRPDPDSPAPVRFLPEYDNLLLGHADRSRFSSDGGIIGAARAVKGTVLIDGTVQAIWRFDGDSKRGRALVIEHQHLPRLIRAEIQDEAAAVTRFWYPEAEVPIRMHPA
ncbi:MAG TPA: winged helix DNA-binding domain-containing protein [Acidimicrobiia bacterium]|nr:winged helix DNA-binding domain-containing protein [Acidimicrobiia bacterium]